MDNPVDKEARTFLRAGDFKKMILGANLFFEQQKDKINSLNVFPVPDGDTGTNMSMTLKAAVEGTLAYEGQSIGELSEIVASRALLGARGNSGVILSQILKGIAHGLQRKEKITSAELSKAFQYGVVYAYKAVSKPVEGTILTVSREMARGLRSASRRGSNLQDSIEEAIKNGKTALAKTTEMLPALKEAGVVDAGGLGLLVFLEGCLYALKKSINDLLTNKGEDDNQPAFGAMTIDTPAFATSEKFNLENPYCTELILITESDNLDNLDTLKRLLEPLGDSLLVVGDRGFIKVHIHAQAPGLVLQTCQNYGSLHDIKIENMIDQQADRAKNSHANNENVFILPSVLPHEKGEVGIISVSFGEGFREIFLSLGADEIVYGGQTMNPNVEEMLKAVEKLPQQGAIILPNNKNIIMVAEQVKNLANKEIEVLKTKTLPEGLAALLAYNPRIPTGENLQAMEKASKEVKTGLVTYATRDTFSGGKEIREGQYVGLYSDKIMSSGDDLKQVAAELLRQIVTESDDLVTIFSGQDVVHSETAALIKSIAEEYPNIEVEPQYGGQPIYYYIFSVE